MAGWWIGECKQHPDVKARRGQVCAEEAGREAFPGYGISCQFAAAVLKSSRGADKGEKRSRKLQHSKHPSYRHVWSDERLTARESDLVGGIELESFSTQGIRASQK